MWYANNTKNHFKFVNHNFFFFSNRISNLSKMILHIMIFLHDPQLANRYVLTLFLKLDLLPFFYELSICIFVNVCIFVWDYYTKMVEFS